MLEDCLIFWSILCVISVATVFRNPKARSKEQKKFERAQLLKQHQQANGEIDHAFTGPIRTIEAIKSTRFWYMIVIIFLGIFFGLYLASVYKDIGYDGNLTDA